MEYVVTISHFLMYTTIPTMTATATTPTTAPAIAAVIELFSSTIKTLHFVLYQHNSFFYLYSLAKCNIMNQFFISIVIASMIA